MTFHCIPATDAITSVKWILNGKTISANKNAKETFLTIGNGLGILELTDLAVAHNMSRIRCKAELSSRTFMTSSNEEILLVLKDSSDRP